MKSDVENPKIKFHLECIAERTYAIVTEDQLENGCYKEFPMIVHGFLRVDGFNMERSSVGFMHISDEAQKNTELLVSMAKTKFFFNNN